MKRIEAVIKSSRLNLVINALERVEGLDITQVIYGPISAIAGAGVANDIKKILLVIIVADAQIGAVLNAILMGAHPRNEGGWIIVTDVHTFVDITTGRLS